MGGSAIQKEKASHRRRQSRVKSKAEREAGRAKTERLKALRLAKKTSGKIAKRHGRAPSITDDATRTTSRFGSRP